MSTTDVGSDRRESLLGESSGGDLEISEFGIRITRLQPSSSSVMANSGSGRILELSLEFVGDQDEEEEERT